MDVKNFVKCESNTEVDVLLEKAEYALKIGFKIKIEPLGNTYMLSIYKG